MWRSRRSPCCRTWRGDSEAGAALPAALLLLACLVGVTGWIAGHLRVDTDLARTLADEQEAARVVEAATQVVALALGQAGDWTQVDALVVPLACAPAPGDVVPVDVAAETAAAQAAEDAASRWGPGDTSRWRAAWTCHAAGVLGAWPAGTVAPSVVVWVADDVEGDGEPWRDSNQRIRLRGVAGGRGGTRAAVEATIGRTGIGAPVTLVAWRLVNG